jgi:hypothetical protein
MWRACDAERHDSSLAWAVFPVGATAFPTCSAHTARDVPPCRPQESSLTPLEDQKDRLKHFVLPLGSPFLQGCRLRDEVNAKKRLVPFLAIAFAACAALGPRYWEEIGTPADAPPTRRHTAFRTAKSIRNSGRSASVGLDGGERDGYDRAGV